MSKTVIEKNKWNTNGMKRGSEKEDVGRRVGIEVIGNLSCGLVLRGLVTDLVTWHRDIHKTLARLLGWVP
jgi:hypothetical protein